MVTVLFICIHNAGRSQMAEAFFNKLSEGRHRGISAGNKPAEAVNPVAVEAMREVGIDIGARASRILLFYF
jgi:protein-tyrosine-phosphatase